MTRPTRRPRILYLSFYFPPSRASGVYRARATANYLAEHGWDVTAFASPLSFLHRVIGSVDEQLAETVHPSVQVERPNISHFAWERDLHAYGRFRGMSPILARNLYNFGLKKFFPEHYLSWALASVRKALRMHARRRFDVVLATGNPFASFAAAWMIHKATGVPFAVDYRDAWTLNMFTEEPGYEPGHPAWRWERRILRDASASIFVNQPLLAWYADRYPNAADRMMVVPNGWDPDLLTQLDAPTPPSESDRDRPLRFSFLGTMNSTQPVEQMAEAFQIARRHPDLADAELNIHGHLGYFKQGKTDLIARLGLVEGEQGHALPEYGIHYRGPVSKTEVGKVYQDSDVLVFLAGGARYVTSGKIFEYMASGSPIVSVHAPGIAAQDVLAGYPLWFNPESLDVHDIAESMIAAGKAARDMSAKQRAEARAHADTFTRQAVTAPLEARLRSMVRRKIEAGRIAS
ncbi:glycosyltransferase [Micromonospora chalcea]|uniref:glycosyltransferase n=1 Tax=Micromonospora TaxID=1873 RepID=UPI0004C36181|nr:MULTISPECIES: glycosyltransferase [Micromonospora]MBC8989303.1 glycosyltransferase [Micromonospora chalcea]MBP1782381.1 glycosyltransferase involved in cell wall biosynthesis [Micromonospora sp. HB375]MCK1806148.1 glycosyltransferase [Micromonospora sp. R42106]MCK1830656.1 glycosyltransferase [Micromonospora sp. R42003]MCK1843475.1 glycosyltransferase [Micromonospora sp. R42004]